MKGCYRLELSEVVAHAGGRPNLKSLLHEGKNPYMSLVRAMNCLVNRYLKKYHEVEEVDLTVLQDYADNL